MHARGVGAEYIGSLVGAAVVGVPVVYMLLKNDLERRKTIRTLRAKPPLDAATATGQDVFAIGNVRAGEALLGSPLTDRPCVAFRTRLYIGTFESYQPKYEQIGLTRFVLERRDGSVVEIDAARARFVVPALPLPAAHDERREQFATERGVARRYRRGAKYEEVLVLEGMRLAIAGKLASAPGTVPARLTGDVIIGVPF